MEHESIRNAVKDILIAIGEDPQREGLADTPRRIAEMYAELFSGIGKDPADELTTAFSENYSEPVILRDIPFHSVCEHHFLPFIGSAHIAYIPAGRVAGASKLARALDILASRPQIQERLTTQLADALQDKLQPEGVAIIISAEHLCMTIRGARKPGSQLVTTAATGSVRTDAETRRHIFGLLSQSRQ